MIRGSRLSSSNPDGVPGDFNQRYPREIPEKRGPQIVNHPDRAEGLGEQPNSKDDSRVKQPVTEYIMHTFGKKGK
jgi:hypothetical protein